MAEQTSKIKIHVFPEKREILIDLQFQDMYIKLGPESAHDLAVRLLAASAKAKGETVHRLILDLPIDE